MRLSGLLRGLACACLATSVAAGAQVPDELRRSLALNGVLVQDGVVYAMARGTIRGSQEMAEQVQITVAMRNMAYKLCAYQYSPTSTLETSIKGMSLLWSAASGDVMEVIIRAPAQKPQCRVLSAEAAAPKVALPTPAPAPAPEPASAVAAEMPKVEGAVKFIDSSFERSNGMAVRVYGGEY